MKKRPNITDEQRRALREFADKHGVQWKARLREMWMRGQDEGHLRQVRNEVGPSALDRLDIFSD